MKQSLMISPSQIVIRKTHILIENLLNNLALLGAT